MCRHPDRITHSEVETSGWNETGILIKSDLPNFHEIGDLVCHVHHYTHHEVDWFLWFLSYQHCRC